MYTEEERAKWRERVARWRNGELVYDAGRIVEKSDNTSVQKQEPVAKIKRDFVAEATRKHAAEAVGPDTRSLYLREQSQSAKQYANQLYQKAKDDAKRAEGLELMMKTISPSTYVEAATGLDLGTAGRLITDAAAFGFPGAAKSIVGSTMQYGRKFLLSQMMRPLNKNMPSVAARFRNQEWSNFLSTTNGDNYYRIARNARMLNPDEKYFFSHTTPWEEFSGRGSEFPSGAKRLYEFPTETFGKLNATTHTGLETPESVVDMGAKHLLYGNTSSGSRGPVRVLSDKNAELLEMDPFINGILERPRLPNGFYDKNPNYENIYLGNQTTIDGNTANQALQNATHTVYYPTQGGVQKELYLTPRKTSTSTLISWEDAQKPLSNKQIFPNGRKILLPKKAATVTNKNAASMTPEQWTVAQDAAIARGDMSEAQRLRDLHFKVNAPSTQIVDKNGNPLHTYHGGQKGITTFLNPNEFDANIKLNNYYKDGRNRIGIYTSDWKSYAEQYARGYKKKDRDIYDLYVNMENPKYVSYLESLLNRLRNLNPFRKKDYLNPSVIRPEHKEQLLRGYDGVKWDIENVVFDGKQLKSADAITYDANGVRIPLGERDNFNINDIRYGIIPLISGSTGYGLYNKYAE